MPSSTDNYEVLESIGTGTFATCKKVRRKKDGKVLVWKEIDYSKMSDEAKQMLVVEVNLLRELRHENIVRYYDRVIDKSRSILYIVMEFCEGGDLATYIRKMRIANAAVPEEFVWQMCYQLASALSDCHNRSRNGKLVLHRDLKPANIFLDAHSNAKIGDFGLARVLKPDTPFTKSCVGTPYYMCPEQISGMDYNEKCDIWALGCILYELCLLRPPFHADTHLELVNKVMSGHLQRIPSSYSDELFELISSLLQINPNNRPGVEKILIHPSVKGHPRAPASRNMSWPTYTCPIVDDSPAMPSESQRLREQALESREQAVAKREADVAKHVAELEARERSLLLREKLADERMARAEQLLQEYAEARLRQTGLSASCESGNHRNTALPPPAPHSDTSISVMSRRDQPRPPTPVRHSARQQTSRRRRTPSLGESQRLGSSKNSCSENEATLTPKHLSKRVTRSPLSQIDRSNLIVYGHRALPALPYEPVYRQNTRLQKS